MLKKFIKMPGFIRRNESCNGSEELEHLSVALGKGATTELSKLTKATNSPAVTEAIHLAIDNQINAESLIENALRQKELINPEVVITLLDEQMEQTKTLFQFIAHSSQAAAISLRTWNLLFKAKQEVKQTYRLTTSLAVSAIKPDPADLSRASGEKLLSAVTTKNNTVNSVSQLIISSTQLYQMHHSLFPAEKMLVGAGRRRNKSEITIDAIFEVTGEASAGHVRADARKLARALISMSETDGYFALWIHSHPGTGGEMTYPSGTDLKQENDWLRDYSSNLVNAIMVKDGFVRFWGKALESKQISVSVAGAGVKRVVQDDCLYRLES